MSPDDRCYRWPALVTSSSNPFPPPSTSVHSPDTSFNPTIVTRRTSIDTSSWDMEATGFKKCQRIQTNCHHSAWGEARVCRRAAAAKTDGDLWQYDHIKPTWWVPSPLEKSAQRLRGQLVLISRHRQPRRNPSSLWAGLLVFQKNLEIWMYLCQLLIFVVSWKHCADKQIVSTGIPDRRATG